ncbi:MAG: DUF2461 domain-containing protein [Acidimicrobiia bacterium]|nr:DUF2461 domain-containing protein [Acidimicrobiia bacterium]
MTAFSGFSSAAIDALAEMPGWSKDDYDARKGELKDGLTAPAIALVSDLRERMSQVLDRELTIAPKIGGSVSPLHRDLRFAKDKSERYKDHLLMTMWDGTDKRTAPMLWLRLGADSAGFASGIGFDKTIRERWRTAIGEASGASLVEALADLSAHHPVDIAGQTLARVPKPWPADHPRADLLRHTGFQVRWAEPYADNVASAMFADWAETRLAELADVHHWLVNHVS